ncbi:MAG: hypothetical protein IT550_13105 [Novosphingobium sp.]|jgi:hypothetical protein|nr:hypothetical protein [Novosphingobium sp.]
MSADRLVFGRNYFSATDDVAVAAFYVGNMGTMGTTTFHQWKTGAFRAAPLFPDAIAEMGTSGNKGSVNFPRACGPRRRPSDRLRGSMGDE